VATPKKRKSAEAEYAREAYSALRDKDEDGFVEAFLAAVRACVKGYEDDDEED